MAGYINLVNSRNPLLEYRGGHGLARICYVAPYGCDDGAGYVREAKALTTVLGGIDSLVGLLKRVNRRYQDHVMGKRATAPRRPGLSGFGGGGGEDTFERDMGTLEGQQDTYFVLFAALLNVSVLRSVQPLVAKKGLMVSWSCGPFTRGEDAAGLLCHHSKAKACEGLKKYSC